MVAQATETLRNICGRPKAWTSTWKPASQGRPCRGDTLANIEYIYGSLHDDTLTGDAASIDWSVKMATTSSTVAEATTFLLAASVQTN